MRDKLTAPLSAEDMAPYWFADTKIIESLNYARIMLAKLFFSYSHFAVFIEGRGV
jgi:hypothetical protein